MVIVADSSRMCSCDSHCLKLIGVTRYFVPQNLVRYLRHHACQTGNVLDTWILFFILIVSRGVIQKALNGHAHSSLPWLFVVRKKITSWRRQKLWKPSEHWGGAINQFASDLTPYIWKYQAELSRGLVQLWIIDSKAWVHVGINRFKSIVKQPCSRVSPQNVAV